MGKKKDTHTKKRPDLTYIESQRCIHQLKEEKAKKCRVGGTLSGVVVYCGIKSSYIITFSLPRSGTDGKAWWECTRNNVGMYCWCEVRKEDRAPGRWAWQRRSPKGWTAVSSNHLFPRLSTTDLWFPLPHRPATEPPHTSHWRHTL